MAKKVAVKITPGLTKAVKATGVILYADLGRSPLVPEVVKVIAENLSGYCSLEIDKETGRRGQLLKTQLAPITENKVELCICGCRSTIGGGALAGEELLSPVLAMKPIIYSADQLATKLEHGDFPIFCRVEEDKVLPDRCTVFPDEENFIIQAIQKIFTNN